MPHDGDGWFLFLAAAKEGQSSSAVAPERWRPLPRRERTRPKATARDVLILRSLVSDLIARARCRRENSQRHNKVGVKIDGESSAKAGAESKTNARVREVVMTFGGGVNEEL